MFHLLGLPRLQYELIIPQVFITEMDKIYEEGETDCNALLVNYTDEKNLWK